MPHRQEVGREGGLCRESTDTGQNIDIIIGSIVDIIVRARVCWEGRPCAWVMGHRIVTLTFVTFASQLRL